MTALDASSELPGIATVIKEGNDGNAICQHMDLGEESSPGSSGQNESLRQDGGESEQSTRHCVSHQHLSEVIRYLWKPMLHFLHSSCPTVEI